jgi:hypothetical protein
MSLLYHRELAESGSEVVVLKGAGRHLGKAATSQLSTRIESLL